jgi:hypothetical protein
MVLAPYVCPPRRLTRGRPRKDSAASTLKGKRDSRYLRDRLMQDHPQVYARYMAGELASVHAAATVAGLITTKTPGRSWPTGPQRDLWGSEGEDDGRPTHQ